MGWDNPNANKIIRHIIYAAKRAPNPIVTCWCVHVVNLLQWYVLSIKRLIPDVPAVVKGRMKDGEPREIVNFDPSEKSKITSNIRDYKVFWKVPDSYQGDLTVRIGSGKKSFQLDRRAIYSGKIRSCHLTLPKNKGIHDVPYAKLFCDGDTIEGKNPIQVNNDRFTVYHRPCLPLVVPYDDAGLMEHSKIAGRDSLAAEMSVPFGWFFKYGDNDPWELSSSDGVEFAFEDIMDEFKLAWEAYVCSEATLSNCPCCDCPPSLESFPRDGTIRCKLCGLSAVAASKRVTVGVDRWNKAARKKLKWMQVQDPDHTVPLRPCDRCSQVPSKESFKETGEHIACSNCEYAYPTKPAETLQGAARLWNEYIRRRVKEKHRRR
jgi:hypothetical protein